MAPFGKEGPGRDLPEVRLYQSKAASKQGVSLGKKGGAHAPILCGQLRADIKELLGALCQLHLDYCYLVLHMQKHITMIAVHDET